MKGKLRIAVGVLSLIFLLAVSCLVVSVSHAITADRIAEREAAELSDMLLKALPDADGFTEISNKTPVSGIKNIYKADNDAGYVMRVESKAITDEHFVIVAMTGDGRIVAAFMEDEAPKRAEIINEDVLNSFTKVMGSYNTGYAADVMSNCVTIAKEQFSILGGGENGSKTTFY